MRRILLGGGTLTILLMILLVASPVEAQRGQGQAQTVDSDKLNPGVYSGILSSVPSPGGNFTLRVEIKKLDVPKVNPNQFRPKKQGNNRNQNARNKNARNKKGNRGVNEQQRERQMMEQQMRQYREAVQRQMKMLQQMQKNTKVVTEAFNVEMQAGPNLVVRTMELPFVYDDKGNPKEYTAEEIRQMKGNNPALPGYEATPASLRPGQIVQVSLAPAAREVGGKRLQATTIVILKEADLLAPDPKRGGKKKK